MFDPEFDPYAMLQVHQQELERQHDVINQLIEAHNNNSHTMLELTNQHKQLVALNTALRQELHKQRIELNLLRTRIAVS